MKKTFLLFVLSLLAIAAQALPLFGLYMEKIYKDPKIMFYRGDFDRPSVPIEMDCSRFQQEVENEGSYEWDF